MADITKDYDVPKDCGVTVEDCEDFVHIKHRDEVKLTYSKSVTPTEIKKGIEGILAENEMFAIVQKDKEGLFTWYREKFETAPGAEVVMVYKGDLKDIAKKAKEFEGVNKGNYKQLKTLPRREIAALLGEGIVGLRGARGIPDNEAYLKRQR